MPSALPQIALRPELIVLIQAIITWTDAFDIRNRELKELCRQVDRLQPEDQDIIFRFLDMAVCHNRFKELVDGPRRAVG